MVEEKWMYHHCIILQNVPITRKSDDWLLTMPSTPANWPSLLNHKPLARKDQGNHPKKRMLHNSENEQRVLFPFPHSLIHPQFKNEKKTPPCTCWTKVEVGLPIYGTDIRLHPMWPGSHGLFKLLSHFGVSWWQVELFDHLWQMEWLMDSCLQFLDFTHHLCLISEATELCFLNDTNGGFHTWEYPKSYTLIGLLHYQLSIWAVFLFGCLGPIH